jgi:phytoene synthase
MHHRDIIHGAHGSAMSDAVSTQDSAAFCAELVRSQDFERYAATIFAPADRRRALLALFAFNAEISGVRNHVSQPLPGEMRLQWWTDLLAGTGHGGVEGHPVAAELLLAIRERDLPTELMSRLIEAHQFDLYNDPMPTMAALEGYLGDTAATLFSLAAGITGHRSDEIDHLVRHAGLAYGIARVIATLPSDTSRRQLFLPLQLLEQHGSSLEEAFAGRDAPPLRAALGELTDGAQSHLDTALALLSDTPLDARTVFLPLALVHSALDRMADTSVDPFAPHVTSRLRTLWTLWRASRTKAFRA